MSTKSNTAARQPKAVPKLPGDYAVLLDETYAASEKLAPMVREIGWTHNLIILEKCPSEAERGCQTFDATRFSLLSLQPDSTALVPAGKTAAGGIKVLQHHALEFYPTPEMEVPKTPAENSVREVD